MPDGALRPCPNPRCKRLLRAGERCPEHQPAFGTHAAPTTTGRGYGYAWQQQRRRILVRDGYQCQPCARAGRRTIATEVDHLVPKIQGGSDADGNLEAACHACHQAKTLRQRRRG